MQKQKRITLNADKRKVIADVFQQHFEDNSKFKKAWQDAKDKYQLSCVIYCKNNKWINL